MQRYSLFLNIYAFGALKVWKSRQILYIIIYYGAFLYPFSLDSKEPDWSKFHDFLLGEVRYLSVKKAYPNEAEELFAEAQKMAQLRYKTYIRKSQENWED